jgi:HAD superfamily hydrolase (TIGR01509 family)
MTKAFLFDMDGVLFDSMPGHAFAWVKAVGRFGLSMTAEEVYMNEGRTGAGTINALAQRTWGRDATEDEIRSIYAAKSAIFNEYFLARGEAPVMPGVCDVLERVRARGLQRVIVTGSGQHSLLDNLNRHFPGMFRRELMVTAFDVKRGKPDPEPYLIGLQKAGISADEAMVVENAPLGVEAAHAAGIFTIAVNTGPLPDATLWAAGADRVYADMHALAKALDNSLRKRNTA